MSKAQLIAGFVVLLLVAALGAVIGGAAMAVTALIIAGGAHFIGFLSMATAQAVALWIVGAGAIIGALKAAFIALASAATLG